MKKAHEKATKPAGGSKGGGKGNLGKGKGRVDGPGERREEVNRDIYGWWEDPCLACFSLGCHWCLDEMRCGWMG